MTEIELPGRKKVRHLTLLREPRRLSSREFNALPFAERLEMVHHAQGRQKYNLLLEAVDAEALVRRLPAQEVYLLLKELGSEDSAEMVALADTAQLTACLDLDGWKDDLLDEEKCLQWLALLFEAGEEKVLQTAMELEFELLVLLVRKQITVSGGLGDLLEEDAMHERRLDGVYNIAYRNEESAKICGALLDVLFRRERDFYLRLIEAVRWESPAEIEEEVWHYRCDRLLDLGFPDPISALSVYAWLDPDGFDPERQRKVAAEPGETGVEAPAFPLAAARPRDLLAEVLAGGLDAAACWELTFLLNKVMSADRVDVGELDEVAAAMTEVYRYLNLALEHLSGGDSARAARLLEQIYLEHLFRLGYSLTLRLQRRARALQASRIAPWLDGSFRALLEALCRRKPRLYEGAADAVHAGERPFATLRDLRLAEEWLERIEGQRRLFEERLPFELPEPEALDLDGCLPAEARDVTLSDLFLTALANRLLGRAFIPRPLPVAELHALHRLVCRDGAVDVALRQETAHWLDSLDPGASAFAHWALDRWAEEFCALGADDLDPRYVGGLIVRLG